MRTRSTIKTPNGINWYCEQEGSGPHIVLIPDGFGECEMFDKTMSLIASSGFTVTTFDTPGMSRSSDAPPETYEDVTAQKLASYVISLCDALNIQEAAFWGSSSGGATVLAIAAGYPERVRNGLPHEVPTILHEQLAEAVQWDEKTVENEVAEIPVRMNLVTKEAWNTLSADARSRLAKNVVRWLKGYPRTLPVSVSTSREDLLKRPLDWSIGHMTPTGTFLDNIVTTTKLGIPLVTIAGLHFPYLSAPEEFAKYVVDTCRKYV